MAWIASLISLLPDQMPSNLDLHWWQDQTNYPLRQERTSQNTKFHVFYNRVNAGFQGKKLWYSMVIPLLSDLFLFQYPVVEKPCDITTARAAHCNNHETPYLSGNFFSTAIVMKQHLHVFLSLTHYGSLSELNFSSHEFLNTMTLNTPLLRRTSKIF